MLPLEITPAELKKKLESGERLILIDCREPVEHQIASIEGAHLIPMNTVPARLPQIENLAEEALLVVYCHHGMRSLSVVNWLREQGVTNCQSLRGGIDRWSIEVDPRLPRY
ncbi:MAG: rhodanese-like domain-containing protein [Bryobacteraceae bacterium]|nr:rhodanese-like domain-containing protein [Bryobacteraceae bacterium]MDW8377824.1 rhodanese-like domain-containing protein [Bryobacterales bacterium]